LIPFFVAGTQYDSGSMESLAKTHNVHGARARRWPRARHRRIQDRPGSKPRSFSKQFTSTNGFAAATARRVAASTMTPNPRGSMSRSSSSILGLNTSANTIDLQSLTGPLKKGIPFCSVALTHPSLHLRQNVETEIEQNCGRQSDCYPLRRVSRDHSAIPMFFVVAGEPSHAQHRERCVPDYGIRQVS
jgi:hypothetical protein